MRDPLFDAPGRGHQLDGDDPEDVVDGSAELGAAAQPMDTWSSCMAEVGMLSALAGYGQPPAVGHQGGGAVLGQHEAGVDAGVAGEERRQAVQRPTTAETVKPSS